MFYACAVKFDVTRNSEKFFQGLTCSLYFADPSFFFYARTTVSIPCHLRLSQLLMASGAWPQAPWQSA